MKTTLLCLTASLLVSGCQCITPPAVDTTPPVVTLSVIFTNAAGQEQTFSVTSANRIPRTVTLPIGRVRGLPFTLSVAVSDAGGVRRLHREQTDFVVLPGDLESAGTNDIPAQDFSRCARTWRQMGVVFNYQQGTSHRFRASGTDFAGNQARTPEITVQWQ
jgi:hypothetical protein